MSIGERILYALFPSSKDQRDKLLLAMKVNAKETELLTAEIQKTSFRPEQTQRLAIGKREAA